MSMITPIDSNANTQRQFLTAYWNTETKTYAIACIPATENTSTEDYVFHNLAILIPHLRDEAINLRLVCKALAHPSLRDFYLKSPIDPPRKGVKRSAIRYELIKKVMATGAHFRYSNPAVNLDRSFSLTEFRAFQFHFPTIKALPRLVLKEPLLSIDHFPSARTVTLSYCDPVSNTLSAFPNIEEILLINPDERPPTMCNWDQLLFRQSENGLSHFKSIEFAFTASFGTFSRAGLEHFIRSAPLLNKVILNTGRKHLTHMDLNELIASYPQIIFTNVSDEL